MTHSRPSSVRQTLLAIAIALSITYIIGMGLCKQLTCSQPLHSDTVGKRLDPYHRFEIKAPTDTFDI